LAAGPRFRRAEPDDRRKALIEACASALAELGASGASVREIARRAAVTPGLIRHHFGSLDALYAATYRHIGTTIGEALDSAAGQGETPHDRLISFIKAHFAPPVLDADLLATWTAFWSLARRDRTIHAIHAEVSASYRTQLETLLHAAGTGKRLSAKDAALSLTAMLDGLWLEHCIDPTGFDPDMAVELIMRWIALNKV
jgi:TetR/AcrR family transcriptional regulator, transcriptional repressor of bet genes